MDIIKYLLIILKCIILYFLVRISISYWFLLLFHLNILLIKHRLDCRDVFRINLTRIGWGLRFELIDFNLFMRWLCLLLLFLHLLLFSCRNYVMNFHCFQLIILLIMHLFIYFTFAQFILFQHFFYSLTSILINN